MLRSISSCSRLLANTARSLLHGDPPAIVQQFVRDKRSHPQPMIGAGGEQLANLALYKDSIDRAQVPERHYHGMTAEERTVYLAHMKAVQRRKLTYKDPHTGFVVFTVAQLLLNGQCCGNSCRHCPYGHENVPDDKRTSVFNGFYYV